MNEDTLIEKYFQFNIDSPHLTHGIGDDAAILQFPSGPCVISTDLFLQGAHFDPGTAPEDVGYKALAVNLSDLAAMGARPICFSLALAMPCIDEDWISGFSSGMRTLAQKHDIPLIGGDLSRGDLAVCISIIGSLEGDAPALRRDAAQVGDVIAVTGTFGDAALARKYPEKAELDFCRTRLHRPEPRVNIGQSLRGQAHAAIDVSDGLLLDLSRLLRQSALGGVVELSQVPLSPAVESEHRRTGDWFEILGGGEDYELILTAPEMAMAQIQATGEDLGLAVTVIGTVEQEKGLRLRCEGQEMATPDQLGFDHFRDNG